ncbi:protein of unknown function [Desulfuromusa kysingii]|uniref:DUF4126 domain-containing protein n=1 Tax=Desulfuromusa kysingii TaxID=37625 RepID=A0A1H3WUM3_9BACT|nr:DUF4126 domain-containing protein [Desulfuromusa kysingii]SDZ90877.1 protein of unknown function [Desulfuromusa kysingii]
MEQLDPIVSIIALSMGVAWASGINLYAAILVLGLLGSNGHMVLPPDLEILANPLVLLAAGFMYLLEFFADKVPGIDTSWDTLHTFIRIPAGAVMAAAAVGDVDPVISLAVAIVGGGLAASTHATKTGSRVLINTSPEPVTNWIASVSEDVIVVAGLWTAFNYPWLFLLLLIGFVLLMIWLLPKIVRGVKWVFVAIKNLLTGKPQQQPLSAELDIADTFQPLPEENSEP